MPDTTPRGARWLLWLCASRCALSLIFTAYSGILPLVRAEWGMSAAQAATIQSAWHLGFLLSLFSVGILADRFGARRTYLAASLFAASAALAFATLSCDYWSALLLYGFAGLCSGGSYTPGLSIISQQVPALQRGRAMGWFIASASVGYAASLGVSALVSSFGVWRLSILLSAAAAVLGALFGRIALSGIPESLHRTTDRTRVWRGIADTFKDKRAMACNWAYAFHCWELLGLWAWLPSFLAATAGADNGHGASFGVAIAGLVHLISVAGSIIGGGASDRFGRTRIMLAMATLSLVGSFAIGWLATIPFWLLAVVAALYNFAAIADSSVYSTALAETVPASRLGAAYSVRSVLGFGAGALSPVVFGVILDATRQAYGPDATVAWGLAWASLGLGALLGPFMTLRFDRLRRKEARDNGRAADVDIRGTNR